MSMQPVHPATGALRPLGIDQVRITDGFWARRQAINGAVTLQAITGRLESEGWIGNFDLVASSRPVGDRVGRDFTDSEIYKFLEAAAWELGRAPDDALEQTFRSLVTRVAAAQQPDGYLGTAFGRPGQAPRWSNLAWGHELYCLGHLFQAAVARTRTKPGADDGLVDVARRAADMVCDVFGEGGIDSICGHPEVEVGLAELGRALDEPRYVQQAKLFIDRRGHGRLPDIELGRAYFQDDEPVVTSTVLRGHAVRANYLAAAAVDVAVDTGDAELMTAMARQWANTLARRTYITGGQGSRHEGEAFGDDWELPPDRAYCETCAGVGSLMFGWRLLLATGDLRYADQIERVMYNVVATAVSDSGDRFFYTNPLQQREPGTAPDPETPSPRASSSLRAPWFDVSCCPPNIARTIASWSAYMATTDASGVQLLQYAPSTISAHLDDGTPIELEVMTDYPDSGVVKVKVKRASTRTWTLSFRVPGWADGFTCTYRPANGAVTTTRGTGPKAAVTGQFAAGDVVELTLPLQPVFVRADPRIDAVRGCVAVQCGPVVYCAESRADDALAPDLTRLMVDTSVAPMIEQGRVVVQATMAPASDPDWPCRSGDTAPVRPHTTPLALIPYHDWGERGLCTMRVWLPELPTA